MGDSGRTDKIIAEAAQWSFEGDCSLLNWMQDISKNLEQRATATNEALQQLSSNANRTAIALDNAANSLTALQFTQFVEVRCHDEDETLAVKVDEMPPPPPPLEAATTTEKMGSTEVLQTFLKRNLEMLHKSHEKYALNFEDSDEEENGSNNYIYQPKNPYNDAMLPHIYGSKLWRESWHVGLCDGSNEYSGDEASDAFSETPSSSATDNESNESNTANLSEWASSSSIQIAHKHPAHMTVPVVAHTSRLGGQQEKHLPATQLHASNNDDSDTYSTTSRDITTTNPPVSTSGRQREQDLFATSLRHESPPASTISTSSSSHKYADTAYPPPHNVPQVQRHLPQTSSLLPPLIDATPPTDIFADRAPALKQPYVVDEPPVRKQLKPKPVNLFDDDDFDSFMNVESNDEYRAQTGASNDNQQAHVPIPAARNLPKSSSNEANIPVKPAEATKVIDLFADVLNRRVSVESRKTARHQFEKPKEIVQRQPVKLFDSPESSPPKEGLFSSVAAPAAAGIDKLKTNAASLSASKPSITAKSLFDDDDDEGDDFLNVFGSKKLNLPPRTSSKTLLFDDNNEEADIQATQRITSRERSNLFDDTPPLDFVHEVPRQTSTLQRAAGSSFNVDSVVSSKDPHVLAKESEKQNTQSTPTIKSSKKLFSADIFGDDEDTNDLDDLFRKPPANEQSKHSAQQTVEPKSLPSKENIQQRNPLFGDEFEDENDYDELFGAKLKKRKQENTTNANAKAIEVPKSDVPYINTQSLAKPTAGNAAKKISLFDDDFEDDDGSDLFGVKPAVQLASKPKNDANNQQLEISMENDLASNKSQASEINSRSLLQDDLRIEEKNLTASAAKRHVDNSSHPSEPEALEKAEAAASISDPISRGIESTQSKPTEPTVDTNVGDKAKGFNNNKSGSASAKIVDVHQSQKDIPPANEIVHTTADIDKSQATPKAAAAGATHKYAGLFLDEPPDDDDFFTTLGSSSKQLSISKMTLDLENDFYEPALPPALNTGTARTPHTAASTKIPHSDGNNKLDTSISDYGGLRLFSEIPPDDDDGDVVDDAAFGFGVPTKATAAAAAEAAATNQRLHNVFYDDFTETLAAVQQMKDNKFLAHALFDDEPPPSLDDPFDIVGKVAKAKQQIVQESKGSEVATPESSSSEPEKSLQRAASNDQRNEETHWLSSVPAPTADVIDRAAPKQAADLHAASGAAEKLSTSTGKLQMPNIKINVQALLPGGGFKKPSSLATDSPQTLDARPSDAPLSSAAALSEEQPSSTSILSSTNTSGTSTNENLLSCAGKTRVRVPAGRRPSTRRARQENYRKSLLVENAGNEEGEDASLDDDENSNQKAQMKEEKIVESVTQQQYANKSEKGKMLTAAAAQTLHNTHSQGTTETSRASDSSNQTKKQINLFVDDDDDDGDGDGDFLFSAAAAKRNVESTSTTTRPIQATKDKSLTSISSPPIAIDNIDVNEVYNTPQHVNNMKNIITTTTTRTSTVTKSLFGTTSSGESDDDLFKSNKQVTTKAVRQSTQVESTPTTTTAAHPASVSSETRTTTTKTTVVPAQSNKLNSIFGSDEDEDDDFLSNLKANKKKTTITPKTTKLLATSSGGVGKQTSASSGGLFSDIESDDDDLFGGGRGAGKANQGKTAVAPISQLPSASSALPKASTTKTVAANKPADSMLADNPLADLLNP